MKSMTMRKMWFLGLTVLMGGALAGCPAPPTGDVDYDAGFLVGFAQDDEYWLGFDDGYDTVDGGPIYYSGSEIPFYDDLTYDAGYWDGVWYAYNDGYFVDYDYAFTIGFSEGYDVAYDASGYDFVQDDVHVEWLDGGFSDGYNDGFSEGRVFGAYDYETDLAFDWFDALLDYRDGTDVEIAGVSTGNDGPVELYVYGVDPNDLVKTAAMAEKSAKRTAAGFTVRRGSASKTAADDAELSYRTLPTDVQSEFNKRPTLSPRSDLSLTLTTTWLERVNAYRAALEAKAVAKTVRVK